MPFDANIYELEAPQHLLGPLDDERHILLNDLDLMNIDSDRPATQDLCNCPEQLAVASCNM